ncbi:MAG: DUF424 domain-containing protein [Methanosarcinaceae archaeon]
MYLKIHKSGIGVLVAVCDTDVLGKTLQYGNANLEISEGFYKGDIASEKQIFEALANATTANLFGKKAVACAIKCGAVDSECVITIDGVPHAQIF